MLTRFPAASMSPTPTEVTPRPPIWIKRATTVRPNTVKCSAVSTTIRPVTQTALVEVKRASVKLTSAPGCIDMGSSRRKVPHRMTKKKPMVIRRPGG